MTRQSALAAGCIMGNCLLGVDLCIIKARWLGFCVIKVMCVYVQVSLGALHLFIYCLMQKCVSHHHGEGCVREGLGDGAFPLMCFLVLCSE